MYSHISADPVIKVTFLILGLSNFEHEVSILKLRTSLFAGLLPLIALHNHLKFSAPLAVLISQPTESVHKSERCFSSANIKNPPKVIQSQSLQTMEIGNLELSAFKREHNAKTYCHELEPTQKCNNQRPQVAKLS